MSDLIAENKALKGQIADLQFQLAQLQINKGLNMTFIDFINQYRIARFKELVNSEKVEHLSLSGLAHESGFNSKSTFNRVFKKMEVKSPSSYLKES